MLNGHALCSPSGGDRWIECVGSVALSDGIPDTQSDFADEGSAAHQVGQWSLESGNDPAAYLGRVIEINGKKWEVTEEMVEPVRKYVEAVRAQVEPGDVLLVEQKLRIEWITTEQGAEGTADAIVLKANGELQIHDLKYGRGNAVQAENNKQLMIYALAALAAFDVVGDITSVRLFIHQPRVGYAGDWSCDIPTLREFGIRAAMQASHALDILRRVRAGQPVEGLSPSPKACQWCRAKAKCPALGNAVDVAVRAIPTEGPALADAMAKADLAELWVKAVRGEVERRLIDGIPVPGFKLVQGKRGARAWKNDADAEALLKSFRLPQDDMYAKKLISPTQAEKVLAKESPIRWAKVQGLITQTGGNPTVVPDSDKRQAITVGPRAGLFAELTEGGAE